MQYESAGLSAGAEPPEHTDLDAATAGTGDFYSLHARRRVSFDGHASLTAVPSSSDLATATSLSSTTRTASDTSSFVIFGGDEFDDDEGQEGEEKPRGVMTSAGASAARMEQMRVRNLNRSSPIQEGSGEEEEEDEGSLDGDRFDDDLGVSAGTPWKKVGGFLRQMSGMSRGVSFFVEGADDDGLSYHDRGEDDIDSSGTSMSRRLHANGDTPSMDGRRCSSQPSMTDLASYAQQDSMAQRSALNMRETARKDYNSQIMPNKVVLIRHGQSEGNVEESLYATTPDNAMKLTALGWDQAKMAGRELRDRVIAQNESIHFVVSPYVRTVETFHGILSAWCDPAEFKHIEGREKRLKAWYGRLSEMGISWHEDPRIREQDFGVSICVFMVVPGCNPGCS